MKIIKLLRTFSEEELRLFKKYLKSPTKKSERKIIELYNYLVKFYPEFDPDELSNEKVFGKLFKGKTFNSKKLTNLYTALTKSAKEFLTEHVHKEDELEKLLNLSRGYVNRSLYAESNGINKSIEEKLKSTDFPTKNYASKLRQLADLQYSYYTQDYNFDNISKGIENLSEAALLQFVFDYMHIAAEMEMTFDNYGRKVENTFIKNIFDRIKIEEWLKVFEKSDFVSKLYLELHYLKYKTSVDPKNHSHYFRLKETLLKNLNALERFDRWSFFMQLVNYAMQKEDSNVDEFRDEGLSVFKSMLESNSHSPSEDQYLNIQLFRCIILCCNTENEAEWLQNFTNKYTGLLHPAQRDNLTNYAKAHLHFLRSEYGKTLEHASRIKDEFFFFKTDVDTMYLRTYYELGDTDGAFHALEAFKHFVNNNKNVFDDYKVMFVNFIKFYEKLLKIKPDADEKDLLFIKKEIKNENNIVIKNWLIKKVDALLVKLNPKVKL